MNRFPRVSRSRAAALAALVAIAVAIVVPVGLGIAAATSNGLLVYTSSTTLTYARVRTYSPSTFGAQGSQVTGGIPRFMVLRASPTRANEYISAYVDSANTLRVFRYDGSTWTQDWTVAISSSTNFRRFDVAYEGTNGRAVVVYGTSTTEQVAYRTYDGTSWTASAATYSMANLNGGTVTWLKLAPNPVSGSNELALTASDSGNGLATAFWSATLNAGAGGFGTSTQHTTSLARSSVAGDLECFDQTYESLSGELLIAYEVDASTPFWRAYQGGAWNTAAALGGTVLEGQMSLASDPASDRAVVAFNRTNNGGVYSYIWNGTSTMTANTAQTNGYATATTAMRPIDTFWAVAGGVSHAYVFYTSSTSYQLRYLRYNASTSTWTNTGTYTSAGPVSGVTIYWISAERDPLGSDVVMLTYSDSGSDLWARQITAASAGTLTFADPNPSAGTALATSSSGTGYENFAFAYYRYSVMTTVTTGTDPTDLPAYVAPGSAAQVVDDFTVQTNASSDSITAVQVTLANYAGVGLIEITDETGVTVFGSAAPTADVNNITLGSAIPANTTLTRYKIRITPASATAMPVPQGSVLNVTARISDITVTNAKSVSDTSATLVIDNSSSPNVGTPTTTGGVATVTTTWPSLGAGTPPDTDFSGTVLVLGNDTQAVSGAPTEGVTSYTVGDPVGSDTVLCFGAITSCQKTGLGSADTYYFEIFTVDGVGNWSTGVATSGASDTVPVTTIGTGSDPTVSATYVAPGTGAVVIDAFTVQKSASPVTGDTITAVEVTFATGTAQGIGLVEIINNAENTLHGSAANPSDVQSIALTTNTIPSTTTSTQYKIRVTPRSHANMPSPAGGPYSVTARISDVTVTYAKSLGDTVGASATLNIDNQSADNVTGASASASGDTVTASWNNPAAGAPPDDFASVIVVGNTAAISGAPTEGQTTYGIGDTVGSGTVLCIDPAGPSCSRNGLSAGQTYYMRIFTRDAFGNWSSGVPVSATIPNYQTVAGALSADLVDCGHVLLQANYTGDHDDDNSVTFARGTAAAGPFGTTVCSSVGGGTNPRTCTDTTGLTPGSTFYYQATFTDPDNSPPQPVVVSGAVGIPQNCAPVQPGDPAGSNIVLSIINPSTGAAIGSTAGGFRVQVRVFSRDASAIASMNLTTDGSNPDCAPPDNLNNFLPTVYDAGPNAWVYQKTVTLASSGTYLLRACARNANGGQAKSEAVTIRYNSANPGDGNLLVRDNSSQLCDDCHAVKTHSSESTSSTYGSWSTTCRDCHQPHSTRNLKLVAEQINTPSVDTYLGPVNVEFRDTDTGDSQTSETISFVTSDATKLAAGRRGPCQACHTRTMSRAQMTGGLFNPGSASVSAAGPFVSGDVGKYILGPDGKSYQITVFNNATLVTISPAYAGSTQVSNYTFQWGRRRWRNAGNDDSHYAGASTSMCSSCHSHTEGFGSTTICLSCHGTTGGDVNDLGADGSSFWMNNAMAQIDRDQWTYSGHGRTSGTYDVTGNVAPAFSTSPTAGLTECLFCHDDIVAHRTAENPFRLRGASTDATGNTGTYDAVNAPNASCLNCHKTSSFGVNNGGGVKNGGVKVEESHNGTKHTSGTLGGKFCWDCHEPHGDRTAGGGNIAMIRARVLAVTDGTYGYLGASGVERTVTYTDQSAGGAASGRAVSNEGAGSEQVGICQACHGDSGETYWTKYWNHLGYDDVNGPPNSDRTASGHQRVTSVTPDTPYCIACHKHSLKFAPDGTCTTCHDQAQTITMGSLGASGTETRRDVVTEFGLAWSHKRNAATPGSVTANDCGVCHMEGDAATGSYQASHGDGYINLRDPQYGTNIKRVQWSGAGAGAYADKTPAEDSVFPRFSRDLGASVIEEDAASIMINQCLKCHDANGAENALAQVPTGSAGKPFGTTIPTSQGTYTGASGYTACTTGTDGCVVNVDGSFTTTNSSYHPVKGKNNNWYTRGPRMVAPWDLARVGGTPNTTEWGLLLSCWDCHANSTDSGVITKTVTAHGGAETLRGNAVAAGTALTAASAVTLCNKCHYMYNTCGSAADACGTTYSHGANSAFSSSTGRSVKAQYLRYGCNLCHSSGYRTATAVARPVKAIDSHGVNALPTYTTGAVVKEGRWAGATNRPYAFIRNIDTLGDHTPKVHDGVTEATPQCAMLGSAAGGPSCNQGAENLLPGGTF